MLDHFWIVVLFPLLGAAVNGILGRRFPPRLVAATGCAAVGASFLVSILAFREFTALDAGSRHLTFSLFTWIQSGDFSARFSLLLDPLSMTMILIVTGVGFLIHVYSVEYMAGESGYYRYFAYLNLFIFMMSVLVLADNYLLMFVGWEGVGLCSYLLIGYSLERKSAGDAAKKAFIVNRIGDVGFILGVFLIFTTFGSVEYAAVFQAVAERFAEPQAGFGVLAAITLLLFLGAAGKSAQIPLYVWLPDAMEGPTPVSALIHAATMVTAGVYMIARSAALYSRAPETLLVVAVAGTATALLAGLIAVAQRDIKRVLAYSTVSQLGYMFLAVGVGAFGAGVFHLFTHAFFKALLFLGSGSVILALHHEQDMFRMGGLGRHLRITCATMWLAALAIAGFPPFSGFFSKDEILWRAFSSPWGSPVLWLAGVLVAGLTAFYMFRLLFLTFHGRAGWAAEGEPSLAPREPSLLVTAPLMILAFFSVVAGLIGPPAYLGVNRFEHFLEPSFRHQYLPLEGRHSHLEEMALSAVVVVLGILGAGLAAWIYVRDRTIAERLARRFSFFYQLVWRKFLVDELYDWLLVRPLHALSRSVLWRGIDVHIIDGAVNGTATLAKSWSRLVRRLQSGYARSYATWVAAGAVLILLYYWAER